MKNAGLILLAFGLLTLGGGFLLNMTSGGDDKNDRTTAVADTDELAPPAAPVETQSVEPTPEVALNARTTSTPLATRTPRPTLTPLPAATSTPFVAPRNDPPPTTGGGSGSGSGGSSGDDGGTTAPNPTPVKPPPPVVPLEPMEQEMYNAHNAERSKAGAGALVADGRLVEVARARAFDMAANNYFATTSPGGETAFTLMARIGYSYAIAGENIGRNNFAESQAAGVTMTGFLNSPAHRTNVVDPRFGSVGIGVAVANDGMKYFVVVFAGN